MDKKKLIAPVMLALMLGVGAISGCIGTEEGQSIEALEEMTDLEYSRWKLYLQLGVKIGANRLLEEQLVTADDLELAAVALETLRDQDFMPGTQSLIRDALADAGMTSDEIAFLLVIVEQELIARGALDWINPETNVVELSPRTEELLTVIANSLRSAMAVSSTEMRQGEELETEFNGKIL